jgi:hypothetical protein
MKSLSFIISILIFFGSIQGQNLKQVKKNIPHKKVSNVAISAANSNWFTFNYKEGKGLWENEKSKVIYTSQQAFHLLATANPSVYIFYDAQKTGYYLPSSGELYFITTGDTNYDYQLNGRFSIFYNKEDKQLELGDTLRKENFYLSQTKKDLLVYHENRKEGISNYKLIDAATNKVMLDVNKGALTRMKAGYQHEIDRVSTYYDAAYQKQIEGFTQNDIMNLDKLSTAIGCSVDSVRGNGYMSVIFRCNGKYGIFNYYMGVIAAPVHDFIVEGQKADILVANNKLGIYVSETGLVIPAAYNQIDDYCFRGGVSYIKMGDRLFTGTLDETIYFSDFREIENTDTLNFNYETREALASIVDGNLILSQGFPVYYYELSEYGDYVEDPWYKLEGFSGVYNYDKAKWLVKPDKYLVYPYGNNYLVGDAHKEGSLGNYYLLDNVFNKIDNKTYTGYQYLANQLFVYDSSYVWYIVNETPFKINKLGSFYNSNIIYKDGAYFMIGSNLESNYGDALVVGVLDKNYQPLPSPKQGTYSKILINGYALVTEEFFEYEPSFALYDIINEKIIGTWQAYLKEGDDTKVIDGWGDDKVIYDLKTLRKY